jgi:lambda repressor-like predicted transcriptional regulator
METTEDRATLAEMIQDNIAIEIVCKRESLAAIAARCGISPLAIRRALQRSGPKATPRLIVQLHNQQIVDSAIKRAVIAALTD